MQTLPSPWYGLLTTLLLSLVLMNWLTCTQEFGVATLVSLVFFVTSTSIFLFTHNRHAQKWKAAKSAIEASTTSEYIQIKKLKEQLRGCLQYGDTEKADEISQKLVALNRPAEPGA